MSELSTVRALRPYTTESDWLREEGWTIGRKSVYLIGIPPQPEGTRVRCELALQGGRPLLVAEGVVIKYSTDNGERPPGLVVRYRRLSTASSQFIDRVLITRDATESSSQSVTETPLQRSETHHHLDAPDNVPPQSATSRELALSRLRGRHQILVAVGDEQHPALERLRSRTAKSVGS